jgi:hypothetical protein
MAICKKCPQEISYKGGSTSGLKRHLLQHGIGEPSEPQPLERVPMTDELKEKLDNSVAEFIITDFQPFHVVEAPAFRKMVTKLNPQYSPPHRTSITKRVLNVCHEVESNVRREIRQLQWLAITVDGWTSTASDSYIMVTGHWLCKTLCMYTVCAKRSL